MTKIFAALLFISFFTGCNNKSTAPDVSDVNIQLKFNRFDRDFFALDTNTLQQSLSELYNKYPVLTPIFIQNILGLDSASTIPGIMRFLNLSDRLYDTVNAVFKNTGDLERDFKKAFQYVKYYFPKYEVPVINTVAGPVDALAQSDTGPTPNFLAPGIMGISLQFYLGKNFSVYNDPFFIENLVPVYRSRRFSKEYITSDAMQLVISDIFPYKSANRPLVEQMVEKGKRWYMLDKFIPGEPDSIKTGYTGQQLEWCKENEGLIWSHVVKNENLQSLSPTTLQTYLGEGPFTQGFNQDLSPGNLGQWIGWQIVKKYVEKNASLTPEEIMNTDPNKILDEARYKPK
jgi:hypothetical protein